MRRQISFLFALFLTFFALGQEVKLTHNLPASANAGRSIDAEFTLTKGSIGAFAKFQCDLPAEFQAQAMDTKSGNFTYENNRVKIVWVSLPGDPTFTFSFKIIAPPSASGNVNIAAQFYYLENNVKKEYDIPAHTISFGGAVATNTTPVETKTTPVETTPTETKTTSVETTPTETKTTPVETTPTETKTTPAETTPTETKTTPVETTPTETKVAETKTTPVETKTTPVETKTTPKTTSRSGVTYHIQLAALSGDPGGQFKKYGKVKVVQEGGMYKVLAGNYSSLEEARSHKKDFTDKGVTGVFVVGYENGVRIKL